VTQVTDVRLQPKPIVLLILDGWGLLPSWQKNAIISTSTPTFDYLWKHYPHAVLQSFKLIGNQEGQIRSSEIGHASIGSGRIVKDDLTELNAVIENGQFFENASLQAAMDRAKETGKAVHLVGLMSEGGIQGSLNHAIALVKLAKQRGVKELWLHPITDGLDVPNRTAVGYLHELQNALQIEGLGTIGTIMGRNYAMNQDENWQQTALAYRALLYGDGPVSSTPKDALESAYAKGYTDATLPPVVIENRQTKTPYISGRVRSQDVVISWNFRYDGIGQLVRAFLDSRVLRRFVVSRQIPLSKVSQFISLTDYHLQLPDLIPAFPAAQLTNTLPELLETHTKTQLRVAEVIKYSHITYFFNGGQTEPFAHEARIVLPSAKVKSVAQEPQMATGEVVKVLEKNIRAKTYDFILANLPNVDAVAKTGDIVATSKAVQIVDEAIRRIANATIESGGVLLVTADHGNAEQMRQSPTAGQRHTVSPVPFILVADQYKHDPTPGSVDTEDVIAMMVRSSHTLADVAPTVLELFGIAKPSDMTGSSLLTDISTR
jgi:2,3-bisphosphoglycerate-independent phosphoglycerate mutase